jgi:hypothetical protein
MRNIFFVLSNIIFLTLTSFAQSQSASSGGSGSRPWLLSKGAAAREAKRFTLGEWLENKDRRALMDMWLTINTPTPYEIVGCASLQNYKLSTKSGSTVTENSYSTIQGEFSAYAKFAGITLEHTNNRDEKFSDVTGIFNLRLFGYSTQGSHLTLHYGLRTRTGDNGSYRLNQPFPAVTLQIYLMKYLGLQGNYRAFSETTESTFGSTSADELTYGVFIEYGLLRLFGDVYQERQNSKLNNIETNYKREGARVGLKFFF